METIQDKYSTENGDYDNPMLISTMDKVLEFISAQEDVERSSKLQLTQVIGKMNVNQNNAEHLSPHFSSVKELSLVPSSLSPSFAMKN